MDNNQNNMVQNDYYNNDSYYSNNNYNDNYNNTSYTQEKKSNGLWWKILLLIILIVIIILLLLKFCGSGSGKSADEKYAEFSKRICDAAKTHIGNNPSLMGTAEPGKSVVIKLRTLADANLISAQLENPYYDGNLFKKGTQDKYYPLNNSVRVMVASDGSYYCELVDNSKDVTPPELRLNGDAEITMTVGTDFEDPGYSATDDFDGDITDKVVRSGSVDNSKAGTYTLTYTVQDSAGNTTSKTRTIIFTDYSSSSITLGSILDGVTPMIKLRGANPYCMVKGTQYVEPGAMATDNVDGNITDRIAVTNKVTGNIMGTFRLVYTVEDSSGNKAIAYRAVIVTTECPEQVQPSGGDSVVGVNNAPVITLVGKNSVTIAKGSEYIDLGATAYDKEDGDITSQITTDDTQVNVNAAGIYKVIYRVTDSGGKTATKSRIVTVKDNSIVGNPQVRFTENKENITVRVNEGSDILLTPSKAVNENGVQVAVTKKIEDYTTKQAVSAIDWNKVGKYRVIYTAIHGNGTLKQTKTIVVTIIEGKPEIIGDAIEMTLRKENCDISEADLIRGGIKFTSLSNLTPIVTLVGHESKACIVGTYIIEATATTGGISVSKNITVKVVDKGSQNVPAIRPNKVIITSNSANPANVYNTDGKWVGGTITGINLTFISTPIEGFEISHFEYSKTCNIVDGRVPTTSASTGSLTWTEEGKNVVCIRAVNKEGVAGDWSDPVYLYLDKTGPKAKFTHTWKDGVSDWHNTSTLTLTYNATDEGSGLDHFEYTYDDVKAKKAENITTYNDANGSLTVKENTEPNRTQLYVYVRAVDKAGNKGEWTLKPAYANMDTVKPEAPSVTVKGNNTALVELTARAKDKTSIRPSGIGKFVYTLNNGDDLSVTARALRSTTCDPLTQVCPNGLVSVSECVNSARPGVAGKDYTQVEDACERASDYKGIITMPTNTTGANVNYDVRVWTVDRAGNRSDGYANQTVTVTPSKKPVTAVEIYNGDDKIADKASCSNKTLYVGNHLTLKAVLTPTDADNANITWTIEGIDVLREYAKCINADTAQASDCDQFVATLREAGTGTITVSAGGKTSSCVLTVKKGSVTCPAGQYLPKGKDKCEECLAGNYCKGGTYPIDDIDQGITKCPAGQYQDKTGQASCINCPAGKYSNEGATSCTVCPAGRYSSSEGSKTCTKCPAGKYQNQTGQTSCISCPTGKWSAEGATSCYTPGSGTNCDGKIANCTDYNKADCSCKACITNYVVKDGKCVHACDTDAEYKYKSNAEAVAAANCSNGANAPALKSVSGTTCWKKAECKPSGGSSALCPTGYNYNSYGTAQDASAGICGSASYNPPTRYTGWDNDPNKTAADRLKCWKVNCVKADCYCGSCNSNGNWIVNSLGQFTQKECSAKSCASGATKQWLTKPSVPATCTNNTKTCAPGQYLNNGGCLKCPANYWCPGDTFNLSLQKVQGLNECPKDKKNSGGFANSYGCSSFDCIGGEKKNHMCVCPTGKKLNGSACVSCGVANATAYSSGCTPSACKAGYKVSGSSCVACNVANATSYESGSCTPKTCKAYYRVSGTSCVCNAFSNLTTCKNSTASGYYNCTTVGTSCYTRGNYVKTSSSSGSSSSSSTKPSKPSGGCFLAGTKVVTKDGYKDIDKIEVGDIVLTYNTETNKQEYNKVVNAFVFEGIKQDLYTLTINGKDIKVTEGHRFYVKTSDGYEYIPAKELKVGHIVLLANNEYHTIDNISHITQNNVVYNMEVENNHNYYVGDSGILVHNVAVNQAQVSK